MVQTAEVISVNFCRCVLIEMDQTLLSGVESGPGQKGRPLDHLSEETLFSKMGASGWDLTFNMTRNVPSQASGFGAIHRLNTSSVGSYLPDVFSQASAMAPGLEVMVR